MQRLFQHEPVFDRAWKDLGCSDDELHSLQRFILQNPKYGDVIPGTSGIRKLRWKTTTSGKSGGLRVFYLDFEEHEITFLLFVISKREESDLSPAMKDTLRDLVTRLKRTIRSRQK